MGLPTMRQLALSAVLSFSGAAAVTLIETSIYIANTVSMLHGKFGLSYAAVMDALAGGQAWIGVARTLAICECLFWPLAAWRIPLAGSVGGLILIDGIAFLVVRDAGDLRGAMLGLFGIGLVEILFLRLGDRARRKWEKATS